MVGMPRWGDGQAGLGGQGQSPGALEDVEVGGKRSAERPGRESSVYCRCLEKSTAAVLPAAWRVKQKRRVCGSVDMRGDFGGNVRPFNDSNIQKEL